MSGLDVVFTACKDFSNGKINERQVEKRLKKYLRRAGNDTADSVSELSEIFNSITRQGLEPRPASAGISSTKRQSAQQDVQESAQVLTFPPDLQRVIDHWDTLPAEIKQAILTLVKHSR